MLSRAHASGLPTPLVRSARVHRDRFDKIDADTYAGEQAKINDKLAKLKHARVQERVRQMTQELEVERKATYASAVEEHAKLLEKRQSLQLGE
eukprot:SAG22_NODE_1376_length_4554_cov_11.791919_2_plen_93_part_00